MHIKSFKIEFIAQFKLYVKVCYVLICITKKIKYTLMQINCPFGLIYYSENN